ncbi:acyl-[acyl-carrier-protein]--UDP-N-acetylglucosamine O-acyltransferase [Desulfonatronum thiosulfatophilum]|uniref:Acyl-[acyl-carrier-protein]--UDP-N-acetylglucosamine O-acyltransferase n=1 Tax=Desulfonatronum thiosulfatophilum TaxID=617002 RepID=A0A1G6C6F4_9BACT|nr:acyl-ACP--UDP-N-acetylglucosamine O-acyltransferase [Desulfonatronum thiosulfatophilum]SDB28412.1 acyl-[acyl-carrier-protein]--UDP-N-acetylglucosamine O-acyltransferase [Desulfonatronum thiosulfatophilum]
MATQIHSTALVDPGAQLGQDVQIGPYCIIEADVSIGDRTRIDAHSRIHAHTSLGADNHVHSFSFLGGDPQHVKYKGEPTRLEVGDRNLIREYCTMHRGTVDAGGVTRVSSDCLFMAYAHVAHDCVVDDKVIMANAATLGGHVHVGTKAVLGGLCAVHQFARIGAYAFIGGKAGISLDIPPYMIATGTPAKLYGPNVIGLKRQGFSSQAVSQIEKAYKIIWRSGKKRQDAIAEVQAAYPESSEVGFLIDFLQFTVRGVSADNQLAVNGQDIPVY